MPEPRSCLKNELTCAASERVGESEVRLVVAAPA